jgi:hypothetical protein
MKMVDDTIGSWVQKNPWLELYQKSAGALLIPLFFGC